MGNASTSASELKGSTDGLSDNISEISDSLNEFPSSDKISNLTQPFNDLADAIEQVAKALGINGEGSVSSLITALEGLGNISLGDENTGLVAQFNNLASAITAVSSAINGTGGSTSSDPQDSKSPSMSAGATGTGSSITSALDELKQKSDTVLGSGTEEGTDGSGDGVIGQFGKLKTGVDDVNTSISGGGSGEGNGKSDKSKDQGSDGDTSNLIGSITELGNTTSEVMGGAGENGENNGEGVIGKFQEFTNVVDEANNYFTEMLSTLEELSNQEWEIKVTVTGNGAMLFESNAAFVGGGNGIKPHYKGTVGKAYAKGYPGLLHNEKNALRSEYGQQELTVYPDGTWELTDKPTIDDLPKDTVIFNEDQTKKILNNKGQTGNAHAKGASEQTALEKLLAKHGYEGAIVEEYHLTDMNGNIVTQQTFDKMAETFTSGVYDAVTPLQDFAEKVQKTVKIIEGSNIVNNNQQQPINQTINVTLPNVTDRTSATELLRDLESLSTKKLQYNWKK